MFPIYTTITFDPPAKKYSRKLKNVTRAAHYAVAHAWWRQFAALHFKEGAAARYGYKPRTAGYLKRRRYIRRYARSRGLFILYSGTPRDLLLTGVTRAKVLARPNIKAFPTRATHTMYTPGYIRRHPKLGDQMAREVLKIAPEERRILNQVMEKTAVAELKKIKGKHTVTIRG